MNTTYFRNQIMGNVFHTKTSPALPQKYYIGLSTTEPREDGYCDGEPSTVGTGYSRILLNTLSAPSNGIISNAFPIIFSGSTTDWGVMKYYTVYDEMTGGHLLFFGRLATDRAVVPGTILIIEAGDLLIELLNERRLLGGE